MIDMHTHILPGVDDGSGSMEESVQMLLYAESHGIKEVLLTPHGNIGGMYENGDTSVLEDRYTSLCEVIEEKHIRIKLHLGMEVFGTYDIDEKIRNRNVLPIGSSNYMFVEFPFESDAEYMFHILKQIRREGLRPIIAHPERYAIVQHSPGIVYEWNRMEYGIQINKGSLSGSFGRNERYIASLLLKKNLVQIVASDCHNCEHRRPGLDHVYQYISENYSAGYAELLMCINPGRVLKNETLLIVNPRPV